MELNFYLADAFCHRPFSGNPAAVCISDEHPPAGFMQRLAAETGVSETAFLALNTMQLRWFTPQAEVTLCGHATLATVHILKTQGLLPAGNRLLFSSASGVLEASAEDQSISLYFPAPELIRQTPAAHRAECLGIRAASVKDYFRYGEKELLVLDDAVALTDLQPDFRALMQTTGRGIAVTNSAAADSGYDYRCRYFAPWVGVEEDPVTGTAHCALACYWGARKAQTQLLGIQDSARTGVVATELCTDGRIRLSGSAVTVFSGVCGLRPD